MTDIVVAGVPLHEFAESVRFAIRREQAAITTRGYRLARREFFARVDSMRSVAESQPDTAQRDRIRDLIDTLHAERRGHA